MSPALRAKIDSIATELLESEPTRDSVIEALEELVRLSARVLGARLCASCSDAVASAAAPDEAPAEEG